MALPVTPTRPRRTLAAISARFFSPSAAESRSPRMMTSYLPCASESSRVTGHLLRCRESNHWKSSDRSGDVSRARVRNRHAFKFWRSVPPVVDSLKNSPGLLWSIGIGESPIGLQGTFSIWENQEAISNFAFKGQEHAKVIRQTREIGWYAEELFARFEVLSKAE